MNQIKKIVGISVLAIMLVLSFTLTAFATDITINGGANGSEYAAYKLLNATDGGNGKFAYTLNDTYADILKNATGKTEEADIVEYIGALDSDGIRDFANDVYKAIVAADIDAEYTTDDDTFTSVEQGYYLIAETKVGDTSDTFSLVMLATAGNESITVDTKEDLPTVSKQVEEINDSTGESSWGDSADYDIGDVINFVITGDVSNKYAEYNSYYYSVIDTMDAGLTYNGDAKVYVLNGVNETEITDSFSIVDTGNGFTATSNLKEISDATINASSKILVKYTVTLNENAVSGKDGNLNKVYLEYENNPYINADGSTNTFDKPEEPGKTVEDVNIIFTFNSVVDKIDVNGDALAGAGFTLYKWDHASSAWVEVCDEITGVTTFEFKGLDVGKYKLSESTVPEGYNKSEDIEFEIFAEYDTTKDPHELTAISVKDKDGAIISEGHEAIFSTDIESGSVSTDVINVSGVELPKTGGIGTTIFYIVGGVLVAAAVILLVAKKRMSHE